MVSSIDRRILLGQTTLDLAPEWSDPEVLRFRNLAEKAYQRLVDDLGADVVRGEEEVVPVLKLGESNVRGQLQFPSIQIRFTKEGEAYQDPSVEMSGKHVLSIGELSEPNLTHEFMHLFAQGAYFESQAFTEGMVYGYIHAKFPEYYPKEEGLYFKEVDSPSIIALLDRGVDTSFVDSLRGGGAIDPGIRNLILSHWGIVWSRYLQEDAFFLSKFFSGVRSGRNEGVRFFSKKALLAMCECASSSFASWLRGDGSSIKNISVDEHRTIIGAKTSESTFLIVNAGFLAGSKRRPAQVGKGYDLNANTITINEGKRSFRLPNSDLRGVTRVDIST